MTLLRNQKNRMRQDPSRTTMLRKKFMAEMNKRFRKLRGLVREAVVEKDVFGLKERSTQTNLSANMVRNLEPREFEFLTSQEKLNRFKKWFREQIDNEILSVDTEDIWTAKYVESAYKKGAIRSFMDVRPELASESIDFFRGRKDEFLKSAFMTPERVDKLKLLQTRVYEELDGITSQMSQQIGRALADGMAEGANPREIARNMNKSISKMTKTRARVLARTEVIHAHAEGQLDAFKELGVEDVGVMVEFRAVDDERTCEECLYLDGTTYKVDKAHGIIPVHPNCRCAFIPANVGE